MRTYIVHIIIAMLTLLINMPILLNSEMNSWLRYFSFGTLIFMIIAMVILRHLKKRSWY